MIRQLLPTPGDVVGLAVHVAVFATLAAFYASQRRRDRDRERWDALARRDATRPARAADPCPHATRTR